MTDTGVRLGLSTMKPSVNYGLWGARPHDNLAMVQLAETLGYHSVWTAEKNGTDAVTPLAWLAGHTSRVQLGTAVMQCSARAATVTAATAATLDALSGGRLILGLGPSGPGIVEGWHGRPYGDPLDQLEDYVRVVTKVLGRSHPVTHDGPAAQLPYRGPGATGLGHAMKLGVRPPRRRVPIYLTAMGPRSVELAYRVADGAIPAFYSPYREDLFFEGVDRGGREIDLAPLVSVSLGDDVERCLARVRAGLAVFVGGMGAGRTNFYNRFASRLGLAEEAGRVQELYLQGRHSEAAAALPDDFVDEVSLCGPRERVADRLEAWKESRVSTLILTGTDPETIKTLGELVYG